MSALKHGAGLSGHTQRKALLHTIDLVITWVDGADPRWRAKRQAAGLDSALATANVEGRFRDNGELRYLLRSIGRYSAQEG